MAPIFFTRRLVGRFARSRRTMACVRRIGHIYRIAATARSPSRDSVTEISPTSIAWNLKSRLRIAPITPLTARRSAQLFRESRTDTALYFFPSFDMYPSSLTP